MSEEKSIEVHGFKVTHKQEEEIHNFIYKIFKLSEWEKLSSDKKKSLIKAVLEMSEKQNNPQVQSASQVFEIRKKIAELEKDILKTKDTASDSKEKSTQTTTSKPSTSDDDTSEEKSKTPTEEEEAELFKEKPTAEDPTDDSVDESLKANIQSSITAEELDKFAIQIKDLKTEIGKMFIGQTDIVHMVVLALLCEAHVLLEGVPGLAKSVLIETLSRTISGVSYKRIQFIPDMLPSDLIGGQIYNPKSNEFITVKGPIFANLVLADEVNRAPPKVHAALMEAMAERKVTIDKDEFKMAKPFLVMATQNPLEQKGTYSLPEAVMDRFMFKIDLTYPSRKDELIIMTENNTTKGDKIDSLTKVISKDEILEMQTKVKQVYISDRIKEYIINIIEATRGLNKNIQGVKYVQNGGSPRATIALGIGSKAHALTQGRNYVLPEDVVMVVHSILRHRLGLNFKGKAYNVSTDKIVDEIVSKIPGI